MPPRVHRQNVTRYNYFESFGYYHKVDEVGGKGEVGDVCEVGAVREIGEVDELGEVGVVGKSLLCSLFHEQTSPGCSFVVTMPEIPYKPI